MDLQSGWEKREVEIPKLNPDNLIWDLALSQSSSRILVLWACHLLFCLNQFKYVFCFLLPKEKKPAYLYRNLKSKSSNFAWENISQK